MNKQYSYIIIDDDTFARETLIDLLSDVPELHMLKSISESGMAIRHLATLQPDIVFLDVNMPDKSGMDIQKEIIDLQLKSKVIFTTAHKEFVVEAFKNKAFDYLVKPVSKKELIDTLQRFFTEKEMVQTEKNITNPAENKTSTDDIVLKNATGTLLLKCDDVTFVEADGAYSTINLVHGKTQVLAKNIGRIEQYFPCSHFYKISRSHIINLKYLMKTDRVNKKVVLLINNQTITLKASRELFYDLERRLQGK